MKFVIHDGIVVNRCTIENTVKFCSLNEQFYKNDRLKNPAIILNQRRKKDNGFLVTLIFLFHYSYKN